MKNYNTEVIKVINLVSRYHKNLNWSLNQGEIQGIIGPSGEGKSYFLKILLGLISYESGQILDKNGHKWHYYKNKVGAQFQSNGLINDMKIGQNITMPLLMKFNLPEKYAKEIALHYLNLVGLASQIFNYYPLECSGGMQKRAALAVSLVLEPEILFLDEPTAGLDCLVLESYDALLLKLARERKMTIVMVTHDLARLAKIADRISVLIDGKMNIGTFAQLRKSENLLVREFLESYVRASATF